uniref:Outer membrane lipoprotein carrier protein LolA n=1 Tax=Ammonifex degensii TaxID=42838 RepID=A0A7C1F2Q6_9THEO
MRWPTFSCGRFVFCGVPALAVLGFLAWLVLTNLPFLPAEDPQKLLTQALARTKEARSYSYRLRTNLVTPRGKRCLSELSGVRVLPDGVSVRGKIFNAPVAIVQTGGITYIKDSFSDRWITLEGERLGQTAIFLTELDPLILLDFAAAPTVTSGRRLQEGRESLYLVEFTPAVKNRFLTAQFRDFHYRVAIETEKGYIVKVEVTAQSKNTPTRLMVNLALGDFNWHFRIEPPVEGLPPAGGRRGDTGFDFL